MNKYSLELIERLLDNLNDYDGSEAFPIPETKREEKLCERADSFLTSLMNTITRECIAPEKAPCIKYAYAKIYAFYNSVYGWYCDSYIWEKVANSYFPQITFGVYCLVREFMCMMEDYRDGRI